MAFWREPPLSFRDAILVCRQILNSNRDLAREGLVDTESEQLVIAAYRQGTGKKLSRTDLFTRVGDRYPEEAGQKLLILSGARAEGKPLQHLTGIQFFFEHEYEVGPDVLIPRPETEILLISVLAELSERIPTVGLEIGIGSGVLSVELLFHFPSLHMLASDVSAEALEIAKKNAAWILGAEKKRLTPLLAPDVKAIFEPFPEGMQVDFIVSNPPYLNRKDEIQEQVLKYEPHQALFPPDEDVLYFYRGLAGEAPRFLKPGGFVFLEIPHERAKEILGLFSNQIWSAQVRFDLTQRERVLIARLK